MKNERDYGIDLMRIFCAFLVVIHHVSDASGLLPSSHWNEFFRLVPDAFAVCAVNSFALISGYVGVGRRWKPANWAMLWADGVFYNFVLLALRYVFTHDTFGAADLLRQFLPVSFTDYWYLTMYTGLFVLMPLLNHLLETMPRRRLGGTILAMLALFSLWSSFMANIGMFALLGGFSTGWLAILYLLGGYVKQTGLAARIGAKKGAVLYFACTLLNLLQRFGRTSLLEHSALFRTLVTRIFQNTMDWMEWYISPTALLQAVGLLLVFANVKPGARAVPFIRFAAPLSFGVYLFHDPLLRIAPFLLAREDAINAMAPLPAAGAVVVLAVGVFAFSLVVDFLRDRLFRLARLRTLAERWEAAMRRLWAVLLDKLETA